MESLAENWNLTKWQLKDKIIFLSQRPKNDPPILKSYVLAVSQKLVESFNAFSQVSTERSGIFYFFFTSF